MLKIIAKIPTGHPESHMLAITHDGHYGYTANVGSGTVSVLDLESRKLIDTIAVPRKCSAFRCRSTIVWPLLPIRPNLNWPSLIRANARSATGLLCLPQDMERPQRQMENGY